MPGRGKIFAKADAEQLLSLRELKLKPIVIRQQFSG